MADASLIAAGTSTAPERLAVAGRRPSAMAARILLIGLCVMVAAAWAVGLTLLS